MQTIILSAGMGRRLGDTKDNTKGMVSVNCVKPIYLLSFQSYKLHLQHIIIIVGNKRNRLIDASLSIK